MTNTKYILLLLIFLSSCSKPVENVTIWNAFGEMAGGVTENSIVLQSRLCAQDSLRNWEILGAEGVGRFEIADNPKFKNSYKTEWLYAIGESDFIIKSRITDLKHNTRYFYRLEYGTDVHNTRIGKNSQFNTLQGEDGTGDVSFIIVTGMNYARHYYGRSDGKRMLWEAYNGPDRDLGYPSLKAIMDLNPDFFIGTGDNVYYDRNRPEQKTAENLKEMRQRWHEQFIQPRFIQMFSLIPTYWMKDDHDHRYNDSDTLINGINPSHEMGKRIFIEQLPIAAPDNNDPKTFSTYRINKWAQMWLLEGRDHRSPNEMPDGPKKTLWGPEQLEWLKKTLLESDAKFKFIISPLPWIGPASQGKKDNPTNGYRYERDELFDWFQKNMINEEHFYIIAGDRHWQYHAIDPSGINEFSTGALVDGNSRLGIKAGAKGSTDPEGKINQLYLQAEPSGGFLNVSVVDGHADPRAIFTFYDERGEILYQYVAHSK